MASVIGAGSAALRKVISNPLMRRKRRDQDQQTNDNTDPSGDTISALIGGEIIPRLLLAHSDGRPSREAVSTSEIDPLDASRFATLPLDSDVSELLAEIDGFLDRGVSVEAIYLDLLAPSARRLGRLWEEDECDFVDVTMGLWRLQEVMREVAARSPPIMRALSSPRSILVSPMPGDQHSFGAIMVEGVFARAGWNSEVLIDPERRILLDVIAKRPFDLVALTITRDCPSAAISQIVNAIRSVSANPKVCVMIGGRMVNENPDIAEEVGADGTANDARSALRLADQLVMEALPDAQPSR